MDIEAYEALDNKLRSLLKEDLVFREFRKKIGRFFTASTGSVNDSFFEASHQMKRSGQEEDEPAGIFSGTGTMHRQLMERFTIVDFDAKNTEDIFISPCRDISICRIPRYFRLENHSVTPLNVLFVYEGGVSVELEGREYVLKQGDFVILSPDMPFSMCISDDKTVVLSVMIRKSTFRARYPDLLFDKHLGRLFSDMILGNSRIFVVVNAPDSKIVREIMLGMLFQQNSGDKFSSRAVKSYLDLFFSLQLPYIKAESLQSVKDLPRDILLSNIMSYISKNFPTVTLQELSKFFSFSTSHMSRLLVSGYGKSFTELITEIRLEKIRDLLQGTDMNFEEICELTGYSDPRQPRRLIKKHFGVAPNELRPRRKSLRASSA